MPIRRNVVTNAVARQKYIQGVIALKAQFTGVTTTSLGIPGPSRPVSTWDRFVVWHHAAMNVAHRGPLFLPWHRMMLRTLEQLLIQVLGDPNFGLPYWDWAADGQLTPTQQLSAALWANTAMGSASSAPGPFTLAAFPIRLAANSAGQLSQVNRALQRARGVGIGGGPVTLPTKAMTAASVTATPYDVAPWNTSSLSGFRVRAEGWRPPNQMHNQVHIWMGGDMLPSSSPNDPVFYLNHCNIDRVWERWMQVNGRLYRPLQNTPGAPVGQRINDPMFSPFGPPMTPAQVLNLSAIYTYDSLSV